MFYSYNGLPDDARQPTISTQLVMAMGGILAKYDLLEKVGIHLIHGHFNLPVDTILVGSNYGDCRWTKATTLDVLDLNNIHGHVFVCTERGFHAYECQTGPLPDLSGVDVGAFLEEFASFLKKNKLETVVGLELISSRDAAPMSELILSSSLQTIMAPDFKKCLDTRQTGWQFRHESGELRVCGQTYHAKSSKGHDPFEFNAPEPILDTFEDLRCALGKQGIW